MRTVVLVCLIGLACTCALIATATDRELEAFDPYHPASLLPILASRLHDLQVLVRDLVDGFTASHRQRIDDRTTLPSDPQ